MSGSVTVTPGLIPTDNTPLTMALLRAMLAITGQVGEDQITPREIDMAALQAELGLGVRPNVLLNGNFMEVFWPDTTITCEPGVETVLAVPWFAKATGGEDGITYSQSTQVPDEESLFSAVIAGRAGVTSVDFGQNIKRDVAALCRKELTFSAWILNNTGADFSPTLVISTPNATNDFSALTQQAVTALQVCKNQVWKQVSATFDAADFSNMTNGLRVVLRFPTAAVNATGKTVTMSRVKLELGPEVSGLPFELDDLPDGSVTSGKLAVGAVTTRALANGAVTAANCSLAQKPPVAAAATLYAVAIADALEKYDGDAEDAVAAHYAAYAADANIGLTGTKTIDGVVLADGDLVLLTAQTAGAQNGPWVVRADEWERPDWYPEDGTTQAAAADQFIVLAGTVNGGTSWMIATTGTITIDTTAVAFVQMSIDLSMLNSAGANAEQAMVWDTITGWTPKKLQTCKAWVNFDGVNAALTGVTFSYSGTTITATKAAHGLNVGRLISISGQTGNNAVLNGIWPVKTVPTTGTFTFVVNAAPVGGLVAATVNPYAVRSAFNVSSIDHPSAGVYTVNFETALPDANYTWAILCGISDTGSSSFVTENMVAGVGSLAMRIRNNSDVLANREIVNVMVFGN